MRPKQNFKWNEMTMGVDYYPEHWDKALWEEDLDRMLDVGITVIRIAEFAWNKVEPEEGIFTFAFFDEFLGLCEKKGMQVIFSTPTATPPAWLTEKYPEVLNTNRDGVPYRHGGRRHYNYNSQKYRQLTARIVEREAEHYGKHPAVIGWQIDNELNCETADFYSEADSLAFREYLRGRYRTLEALNQAWGTAFWNQTYTDWDQIHVLRPVINQGSNPHQHLDYLRFVSESAIAFCLLQAEILRKYTKPGDFITTNGLFSHLDNHKMEDECLDIYSYDSYPDFAFGLDRDPKHANDLNDRKWSQNLTEVRSICPHFGIQEQQAGGNGWTTRMEAPAPRPGQLTLWAMQSVAHGADFISFFRWRTATMGTEIYWHGILDYDNRDNRKLAEVKDFHQKLMTLQPICGADYHADVAILKDYDNEWDRSVDAWHQRISKYSEKELFAAAQLSHTPYDLVYLHEQMEVEELSSYPILIYPHPMIMTQEGADLLKRYVEGGGTLIVGCRSGFKDARGQCVMMPQPGLLQELTGTDVRDFTFTSPAEDRVYAMMGDKRLPMDLFNDILTPLEGTRVLATYDDSYYQGEAAITEHPIGKGRVIHVGAAFSREVATELFHELGAAEPFSDDLQVPEDVELIKREKDGRSFYFVLNYMAHEEKIFLKKPMVSLYDGQEVEGEILLPAYGTAVFEIGC